MHLPADTEADIMVAKLTWDRGTPKKFKLPPRPTHGMNIRPCEKIARQLMCEIWQNGGHTHLRHAVLRADIVYDHHARHEYPRTLTKAVIAVWDAAKKWLDQLEAAAKVAVAKPNARAKGKGRPKATTAALAKRTAARN